MNAFSPILLELEESDTVEVLLSVVVVGGGVVAEDVVVVDVVEEVDRTAEVEEEDGESLEGCGGDRILCLSVDEWREVLGVE